MTKEYDVLIVGGGMVGAALGCALGGSQLRVAVIEAMQPQEFDVEQDFDLRVSALSVASQTIMETVGAWSGVVSRRFCPFRRMRVWESAGITEFCSEDIKKDYLGCIVENRVIQIALLECLKTFENIDLLCPAKTNRINYSSDGSTIELEDGRELSTRLLVAADGGQSRVRQLTGMGVTSWDYKQHALVISVDTGYVQQDITWQRFVPSGPQAFLPLPGQHASLVWYHSADEIRRLKALPDEQLLAELKVSFPDELGDIKAIAGRASFPLKRQHAQDYVKSGVALIGDAAHIINPLVGQGVNLGFLDAAALAQVLIEAQSENEDIGCQNILMKYEKLRRNENLVMMTTTDLFYRVFSNKLLPLQMIRNFGLGLAGRLTPAKQKIMRYAIGLEGKLPDLARGKSIVV